MISSRPWFPMVVVLFIVAACSDSPADGPTPTMQASGSIVNAPPYVCKFIPERALRLVTGFTQALSDISDGTADDGDCDAPTAPSSLLDVAWSREYGEWTNEDLEDLVNNRIETLTRHKGAMVPAAMGKGMAAYVPDDEKPHQIVAKFSCGGDARLLMMSFHTFAKDRNSIKDMIELMRIGQERYAELYKCDLGK